MSAAGGMRDFSLEKASQLAAIVGVVLGIVSLWFVYAELKHHTKVSMAANAQALVELTQPVNLELAKDPKLAALWQKGLSDYDSLPAEDKPRYKRIWIMYVNVLENAYYQREARIIEAHFYEAWDKDLERH